MEQAMREEFEAWVWDIYEETLWFDMNREFVLKHNGDEYFGNFLNDRWEVWKASRAALRVEDEIDRLKAENEALLLGMRAILNAYDYADQYNKEGVAVEVMEDLRTLFKGATQ
ncbi:TPA: hypothetical protein ACRNXN_002363 [Pseudomonas aeruginosa]